MLDMSYTITGLQDTIMDNADFRESESVAKAKAFATAVARYLVIAPESSSDQSTSMTLGRSELVKLREDAIGQPARAPHHTPTHVCAHTSMASMLAYLGLAENLP